MPYFNQTFSQCTCIKYLIVFSSIDKKKKIWSTYLSYYCNDHKEAHKIDTWNHINLAITKQAITKDYMLSK